MQHLRRMIRELYKMKENALAQKATITTVDGEVIELNPKPLATAFRAFNLHSTCNGWQDSLRAFVNTLEGKISALSWEIVPKGVLEITNVTFPDDSQIKMTRFINSAGESVSLQLKKVD